LHDENPFGSVDVSGWAGHQLARLVSRLGESFSCLAHRWGELYCFELNEKHHISTLIVSLLEIMWRTFDRRATLCPSGSHASDLHRFGPDLTSLLCPTMPPCQPDWLV
jgi:hypothetical protein